MTSLILLKLPLWQLLLTSDSSAYIKEPTHKPRMFDNNIWLGGKWKNEEVTEWQRPALSKAPLWSKSVAGSVQSRGWRLHTNIGGKAAWGHGRTWDLNAAPLTHLSSDAWFISSVESVRPLTSLTGMWRQQDPLNKTAAAPPSPPAACLWVCLRGSGVRKEKKKKKEKRLSLLVWM